MNINIFKNPIIIGLIVATLTYLYLWWTNEKITNEQKKDQNRRTTSIWIPLITGVIAAFLAYMYFGQSDQSNQPISDIKSIIEPLVPNNGNLSVNENVDILNSSSDPTKSFHLIGKGLNIPNKLPDVFIETI